MLPSERMKNLWQAQASRRSAADVYRATEMDELKAMHRLCVQFFGNASEAYRHKGGWRYGGLIEVGNNGLIYMGYYLDPPTDKPNGLRRRELLFVGCKVSEFEEQMRLYKRLENGLV